MRGFWNRHPGVSLPSGNIGVDTGLKSRLVHPAFWSSARHYGGVFVVFAEVSLFCERKKFSSERGAGIIIFRYRARIANERGQKSLCKKLEAVLFSELLEELSRQISVTASTSNR